MPTITLSGLTKSYGQGRPAVAGLDLVVPSGAFMCLLGPSGCGKTTTLRMVAGLEHPSEGRITIGERVVSAVDDGIFVPAEARRIGMVFQNYALWPHLTVADNVAFGLRLQGMAGVERDRRVAEVLDTLSIGDLARRYPSQLSGGQQQRVALARTLAVRPAVLLMDEPLSNLDARLRLEMRAELKRLHRAYATTIVFVTHDQWEAMTLATEIAVMADGALQQVGSPDAIYARPANRFVAEFVGNPPINLMATDPPSLATRSILGLLDRHAAGPRPASIGIRPEAFRLDPPWVVGGDGTMVLPATVTGILPTGGSWIIETRSGDTTLFALTHAAPRASPGDAVSLSAPLAALHLFDPKGARLPMPEPGSDRREPLIPQEALASRPR